MFGSGWRSTNHVVPFQNSLLAMLAAHLKGVHKGTLIDDSVRPEENDIRRRFLSDEGAAFPLLLRVIYATDFDVMKKNLSVNWFYSLRTSAGAGGGGQSQVTIPFFRRELACTCIPV